jgi:hypothetical protein
MYTLQGKTWSTWHVRFPRQFTYARRTLSVGSPHTWQPFTSHRESWAGPLLPRKRAPDTIHSTPTDPRVHTQFLSRANLEAVGAKPTIYQRQATRLTGSISPACDQYVQCLLAGTNPSVLNRHRRGLPHRNLRITIALSPPFPFECSTDPPKWPHPVSILSNNYQLN